MCALGSFRTALNSSPTIWKETAERAFGQIHGDDFVDKGGEFDKVIMDCTFRKSINLEKPSSNGGCEGFHPSLTTNGVCYTFNGKKTSDLWKSSDITNTFANLFPFRTEQASNEFEQV